MEKWNSERAKELGIDADLLAAVNVAVKKGREQLTALGEYHSPLTMQFRKELQESGLGLYMLDVEEHPLPNRGQPGELALVSLIERYSNRFSPELHPLFHLENFFKGVTCQQCRAQLFLIASTPEEVVDAVTVSLQHNYPREVSEHTRFLMGEMCEDISTREGWLDFVARRRALKTTTANRLQEPSKDGLLNDKRLTREELVQLTKIRVATESLAEERINVGSTKWHIVTLALTGGSGIVHHPAGGLFFEMSDSFTNLNYSKEDLAWEFVSSLLPHLQGDDQAKAQFQKMVSA